MPRLTLRNKTSPATESGRIMLDYLRDVEWLTKWFLAAYLIAVLLYAGAATFIVPPALVTQSLGEAAALARSLAAFLLSIGSYLAVLTASIATGGLLGFLFGIPRLLQRRVQPVVQMPSEAAEGSRTEASRKEGEPTDSAPSPLSRFAGNTNLEDISDWLTKIIVGLGLTQASNIRDGFYDAQSRFVSGAMTNTVGAAAMFTTTVVCGLVAGFLFFYLETRTRLTILLASADHFESNLSPVQVLEHTVDTTETGDVLDEIRITRDSPDVGRPTPTDRQIVRVPFSELQSVDELAVWGAAQARFGRFSEAERAFVEALRREPDDSKLYLALAAVRNRSGRNEKAAEALNTATERFSSDANVLKETLLTALYVPAPIGYETALTAADQLQRISQQAMSDPQVQLWIAAANGQKYKHLQPGPERDAARAAAFAAVEEVARLAPNPNDRVRITMRKIFDPIAENSNRKENDLEVFKDDDDFREAILGAERAPA